MGIQAEDIHELIESLVIKNAGMASGGKMHTARSRNDQVVLDIRMKIRDDINIICNCQVQPPMDFGLLYQMSGIVFENHETKHQHVQLDSERRVQLELVGDECTVALWFFGDF